MEGLLFSIGLNSTILAVPNADHSSIEKARSSVGLLARLSSSTLRATALK